MVAAAIADIRPAVRDTVFRVHPLNVFAVRVFAGMNTQWNMVTLQGLERAELIQIGLRYEAIDRVVRGLGLTEQPGDFSRLQAMEGEALKALARARR